MASSRKITRAASVDGGYLPCQPGLLLRLITVVTVFTLAMPPLPLVAAAWDARETTTNPFVWPPPSVPLPAQVPGKFPAREAFPGFAIAPAVSPLLPQAPADLPWLPGDLDPIAPPDGMPVQGNPAGLALLENAVGNGIVVGEVSDATSLDPIPGALIELVGTGRTAEADAQGRFQFAGLPAGTFNIEASQLGYFTDTTVVTVIEGSPSEIRFGLRARPTDDTVDETTLEEETIVGEYQGDSGGDLFMDLELSSGVTSGISKEDFSRSGVSDAADAVSKISGANIVGGKYAVVRGMADRYSNTLVNGAVISSADPSKKAVQLDLFPSDLLESLSIRKTFTPDLPADFAGGTVLIETLRLPDERIIDFSIGTKYQPSLDGDFYVIPGQRLDYWGDGSPGFAEDVGQRNSIVQGIPNPNPFPPGVNTAAGPGQTPSVAQVEAQEVWRLLHSTGPFIAEKDSPQDQYDFSATYADFYKFSDEAKLGWVFALTREQGAAAERDVEVQRLAALDGPLEPYRKQIENRYKESVDWGFLGSATFELGEDHSINYTYFKNRSAENEVNQIRFIQDRQRDGSDIFNSENFRRNYLGASGIPYRAADVVGYLDRELVFQQIDGSHALRDSSGRERFRVSWVHSESDAEELRPNDRNLRFSTVDFTDPRIPDLIANDPPGGPQPAPYRPELGIVETMANPLGGNPQSPFRQSLSTIEEGSNERIDFELPFYFDDSVDDQRKLTVKAGFNNSSRIRNARGDRFAYSLRANRTPNTVDIDQLLVDLYQDFDDPIWIIGANRPASGQPPYRVLGIQDVSAGGSLILNSDTGIKVDARYLMAALDWDRWNLYGGARVEESTRSYSAQIENEFGIPLNNATQASVIGTEAIKDTSLYPSFGISRAFGANEDLRLFYSWSKTVARPTFLEFAPIITEDQATGEEIRGNPTLLDSEIDNFDLSMAWQASDETFLQFSLFHKVLTNPITKVLGQRASDGFFISYNNAESGTVQGVEIETDHRFNENWNIGGNLSYIKSNLVPGFSTIPAPILADSFEGQPNWILNLNLGYSLPNHGITANLIYNYTGEYLSAVTGTPAVPSVVRDPAHTLDLIVRKSFTTSFGDGNVAFKVSNLLDDATSFSYESGDVYSRFYPGREYSLSLSLDF
jgi:outer membrane receptor protein involved in Fe transport